MCFPVRDFIDLGGVVFRSNTSEAKLRKAKMVSLLWALMTTTKLGDDMGIEIISIQISPQMYSTSSLPLCFFFRQKCSPFLSACSKRPLVISAVKDSLNLSYRGWKERVECTPLEAEHGKRGIHHGG